MAKGKFEYWLTDEGLKLIEGWARAGLNNEQLSHNMGISPRTLDEWKNRFPPIMRTIKNSKEIADLEVENALYKSAQGYDTYEETWERQFNTKTKEFEMVLTKRTKKHILPSNTAQIFWLKNRRPDIWRDKVEAKMDTNVSATTKTIAELIQSPIDTRDLNELIKEAKDSEGDQ